MSNKVFFPVYIPYRPFRMKNNYRQLDVSTTLLLPKIKSVLIVKICKFKAFPYLQT